MPTGKTITVIPHHHSAKTETSPAHVMSANYAAILTDLAGDWGCDTQELLAAAGISGLDLQKPDTYINARQYHALIKNALGWTGEPALGLYYGRRLNISTHGLLGYAILSSPSLAKAGELTRKYIRICHWLIKPQFHFRHNEPESGNNASIRIEAEFNDPLIYRFEMESSLAAIYCIWENLLGSHKGLSSISFKYNPPDYAKTYTDFFCIPVEFGAEHNEICFSRQALKPLERLKNPTILLTAEKQCELLLEKLEKQARNTFCLNHQVRQLLLQTQTSGEFPTQENIAELLHTTTRTMARQLEKENTSFKAIAEQVKKDLAIQYLTCTELTVDEIAYILSYNDASNFTRAFKRWTGLTPREYKAKKN